MQLLKHVFKISLFLLVLLCAPARTSAAEDSSGSVVDITITPTDLLLSLALETQYTEMDCTHLVHRLYEQSGLLYDYADSRSLYKGIKHFRRVSRPQSGDLIVWRGHAGIVVNPDEHTFISALRSGVKVSSYISDYWKQRGIPHFLHYVGDDPSIESAWIN